MCAGVATAATWFLISLELPVLTAFHQSGEIRQVSTEAHHTFVAVQAKQRAAELRQVSAKHEYINRQMSLETSISSR